jgi:hypothetical protein
MFLRKLKEEKGLGSFVFAMTSIPIFFLIMSFVIDSIIFSYAKNSVQSALDSATITMANSKALPGVSVVNATSVYRKNLEPAFRALDCTDASNCGKPLSGSCTTNAARSEVVCSYTANERASFYFINMLPVLDTDFFAGITCTSKVIIKSSVVSSEYASTSSCN